MKKIIISMLLSLFFFQEASTIKGLELIDIVQFAEQNDLSIDEWSVTVKEKMNVQSNLNEVRRLLASNYEETVKKEHDTNIYFYEDTHNDDYIHVSFKVVQPIEQASGELVVTLSGGKGNENILQEYLNTLQDINKTYFTEKSRVYTCLSIEDGVIINSDDFFEKVIEHFNLTNVTTQKDEIQDIIHKKIYYGYTQIWQDQLTITDEPMNVQVVVDGDGSAKQKVIIGTPILINEY